MTDSYRATVAHLRAQRDQIDAAIQALLGLLEGTTPAAPVEAAAQAPRPTRGRAGTRRSTTPAPATSADARTAATGRAGGGEWQARALAALRAGPGDVQVRELVTRMRVPDRDRERALQGTWSALQALVKRGEVLRQGPRYRLAEMNGARPEATA